MLGTLLLISLLTGLWALLAPRSFYDSFPGGSGLHWVAADGPYNRHLVFSVPHWLYHSAHLGLYGARDQVLNEVGLVAVVLLAALLCVPRDRWVGGRARAAETTETAEVRR